MGTQPDRSHEVVRYGHREPYVHGGTVASIQTVFNRMRLSHTGWARRELHGRLDGQQAWRYDARNQVDIFRERRMPSPTKLNVHLLLDASGSMSGERACRAQDLAGTFVEAFKRIPTVRIHVYQHNANQVANVYRVFKPGMSTVKLNTMLGNIGGGNADGFALQAIGQVVTAHQRRDEQDLIIVISDGLPSVTGAGATGNIIDHSTLVTQNLHRKGVMVMGVAIAGDVNAHRAMYGEDNVVGFSGDWGKLSRDFAAVFGAVLRKGAK